MNYIIALALFFMDLLAANIFNSFILQSLLVYTLTHIAFELPMPLYFAASLLALESFLELGSLLYAPAIALFILEIFPNITKHFNIKALSIVSALAIFSTSKIAINLLGGNTINIIFTTSQFFVNIIVLIALLALMNFKGRLGSRFY